MNVQVLVERVRVRLASETAGKEARGTDQEHDEGDPANVEMVPH